MRQITFRVYTDLKKATKSEFLRRYFEYKKINKKATNLLEIE